jgi:hypothetical protein
MIEQWLEGHLSRFDKRLKHDHLLLDEHLRMYTPGLQNLALITH